MFSWIYDVPSLLGIVLFGAGFVVVFWLGLVLLRPFIRRLLPEEPGLNAMLTMYLQYFGIIYGLLLGLLAVGAYQGHAETRRSVVGEAASLAALYRDISGYPEPYRTDLKKLVREYVRWTIEEAWEKQHQGIMPELDGPNPIAGIYERMAQFEPATQGQAAIHQTALKQFDTFVEARRTRLYRVSSGMPRVMWYTVALGALINMIFLWLFDLRVSTHLLLGGLVSFFTATMIYVIAILDTPWRNRRVAGGVAAGLPADAAGLARIGAGFTRYAARSRFSATEPLAARPWLRGKSLLTGSPLRIGRPE